MLRSLGRQLALPLATALALVPAPALACDWGYTTLPELLRFGLVVPFAGRGCHREHALRYE